MDSYDGIIRYKLKKPITTIDGEHIAEIVMDIDSLGSSDLDRCERQARAHHGKKKLGSVAEVDKIYNAFVAAKSSGLSFEDIRSMAARDYTAVCLLVRDFLLDGVSDEDEEETEEEVQTRGSGSAETPGTSPMNPDASMESGQTYGN